MGILKNPMLGIPTGKAGEFIIRTRYGKQVIYSRPKKYKKTKSLALKNVRTSFGMTIKLASTVRKSYLLSLAWKYSDEQGKNIYTKIIKYNTNRSVPGFLTLTNKITADYAPFGFVNIAPHIGKVKFNRLGLIIEYEFKREKQSHIIGHEYYLISVIYAFNKNVEIKKPNFELVLVEHKIKPVIAFKPMSVVLKNESIQMPKLKKFKNAIVYIAFASPYINEKQHLWSSTTAIELEL